MATMVSHSVSPPTTLDGESFQFVNSTTFTLPKDGDVRKAIRRQAMSRVAATRRQKTEQRRQRNEDLTPIENNRADIEDLPEQDSPSHPSASRCAVRRTGHRAANHELSYGAKEQAPTNPRNVRPTNATPQSQGIPMQPSSSGYELLRIQQDFDVLDLSALTTFHAGRATARAIAKEPSRLVGVLRSRQWSYMSFIPSRYGFNACLDDAVHCVVARVRRRLVLASTTCATNAALYSKALQSLQAALSQPGQCMQPDVLCASELLAIYEVSIFQYYCYEDSV